MDVQTQSRRRLIAALQPLAERDTRKLLNGDSPPLISAFVARRQETVCALSMLTAGLVVVVEGRKELVWGAERQTYSAGEAFVLLAGSHVDVVNEPDDESGVYRALFIRFPRELIIEAARLWPQLTAQRVDLRAKVEVSPALSAAIVHTGEALASSSEVSKRIVAHRILEVLLIVAEQGALRLTPKYVDGSVADAIRLLVRHRLDHRWSAAAVASHLSLSEVTLRRRLRQEGQSLRALLRSERMKAAYTILSDRDADVAEAIAAAGYTSRSHFASHFEQAFGASPSAVRKRRKSRDAA